MKILKRTCPFCKNEYAVELTDEEYKKLPRLANECVQDVFPNWKPEKRELLNTGICNKCWEAIFK